MAFRHSPLLLGRRIRPGNCEADRILPVCGSQMAKRLDGTACRYKKITNNFRFDTIFDRVYKSHLTTSHQILVKAFHPISKPRSNCYPQTTNFHNIDKMEDVGAYIFVSLLPVTHVPIFLFCINNLTSEESEQHCMARLGLTIFLVGGLIAGLYGAHEGLRLKKENKSKEVKSLNAEKKDSVQDAPSAPVPSTTPTVRNVSLPKSSLEKERTGGITKIEKRVRFKLSFELIKAAPVLSTTPTVRNVSLPKSNLKKERIEGMTKIEKRVRFKLSFEEIQAAPVPSTTPIVRNVSLPKSSLKKERIEGMTKTEKRVRFKLSFERIHAEILETKSDKAMRARLQELDAGELSEFADWVTALYATESMAVSSEAVSEKAASSKSTLGKPAARKSVSRASPLSNTKASSTKASSTRARRTSASKTSASSTSANSTLKKTMKDENIDSMDWAEKSANLALKNTLKKEQIGCLGWPEKSADSALKNTLEKEQIGCLGWPEK